MKKLKYFIPTIIWMIFIFIMSQNTGSESSNQSGFWVELIVKVIKINPNTLSFIIRKLAHMSEYAILFGLVCYGFKKINITFYRWPLLICFLYACSDEFHQLFVRGRSGQFTDVLIDTGGALMMLIIIFLWQRKKKSNLSK